MSIQTADVLTKTDQVAEYVRNMIRSGQVQPGSRLPTDRDLAKQLGVAYLTIRRANQKLMEEGLIKREQGRGTFVKQSEEKLSEPTPVKTRHLAILFVDISPDIGYNMQEIVALEQWLGQRNIYLSFATISSADLAVGNFPPVLNNGQVDGLFLDGHVMDFHCIIAERFHLPYIVVGNHKISSKIPQIRRNISGMTKKATHFMYDRFKLPVTLIMEPLDCYYVYEKLDGYIQAVSELPQMQTLLYKCTNYDATKQITYLLKSTLGRFSILTIDVLYPSIKKTLLNLNKNPNDYPTLVMGNPNLIPENDLKGIFLIDFRAARIADKAAQLLLDIIEQKRTNVYEETNEEIIES
jgi:DNA-binding transcriptional regulator YhcF (GntR family)